MTMAEQFVGDNLIYKKRGRKKINKKIQVRESCYSINFDSNNRDTSTYYSNIKDENSCIKLIDKGVNISDLPKDLITPKVLLRALNVDGVKVNVDNIPRRLIDKAVSLKLLQMNPLFIRRVPEEFLDVRLCLNQVRINSESLALIPGVYRHLCHIYFYEGCPDVDSFLQKHKLT